MAYATHLKKFPAGSAGNKMIFNVPCAKIGQSILDVERTLLRTAKRMKTIDYIYVLNGRDVLRGVVSIKELLQVPDKKTKIEKIMKKKLVVAHPLTHQERVVYLALKNNLKAVPIVDKEGRFLGIVPYDTILQIFHEEMHEDIFSFAGIHHVVDDVHVEHVLDTVKASAKTMVKARIPWVIVGLVGGIIAASVVGFFEGVLSTYIALAMFMPVLVYMSDAIGTQSETLVVRSIALNPNFSIKPYLLREFRVAIYLALVCGIFLSVASMISLGSHLVSFVIGLSMFSSILIAVFIATTLPLVLRRFKLDPAVAAGPFATVITDILTLAVYFTIATFLLIYFT